MVIHTVPVADLVDHEEAGLECWCEPTYETPCDCGCERGCWKCVDGAVSISRDVALQTLRDGAGIHVVHNAADGRR